MRRTSGGRGARVAAFLERPDVLLQVVPLGGLHVGFVHLEHSRGFVGPYGVVGFVAVCCFYLGLSLALFLDKRLATSAGAILVIAPSPFASLLFYPLLVDTLPPAFWAWLVAPVMMIAVYVCRPRHVVVIGLFTYTAGLLFFVRSGVDPLSNPGLVVVLLVLWTAPAVLTRLVLGNLAQISRRLDEERGRDPISGALNRRGLEEHFDALLQRLGRQDEDGRFGVLVLHLSGVREVAAYHGNTVVGTVLERTTDLLRRAHRRDNIVARTRGETFVVLTPHAADVVAEVVAADVGRAHRQLGITVRVGGVGDVPAAAVSGEWLGALVREAEGRARGGEPGAIDVVPFEGSGIAPIPVPPPVAEPDVVDDEEPVVHVESPGLFGAGIAGLGVLLACIPGQDHADVDRYPVVLAVAAVLGAAGVLVAYGWLRGRVVEAGLTLLALAAAALAVPAAADVYGSYVALALLGFPLYLASLTLRVSVAAWLSLTLPAWVLLALEAGPFDAATARSAFIAVVGFGLITCAMAQWVRRQRDVMNHRLQRMAHRDELTGLLTRAGLVERFRALEPGTEVTLVYVDVDGMSAVNDAYGVHGGDLVLRRVGRSLKEVAGATGAAARVGGDEFLLLVPGVERSAEAVARLTDLLATDEVPVSVSLGQAYGRSGGDTAFWRLIGRADEALLLNRARDRRAAPGRTVLDLRRDTPDGPPEPGIAPLPVDPPTPDDAGAAAAAPGPDPRPRLRSRRR